MITKYSFNKLCDSQRLTQEINLSSIIIQIDHIQTVSSPENTDVWFKDVLSGPDEVSLNDIITAHVNEPLEENIIQTIKLDVEKTSKGIQKVAVYEPEGESATIVTHNFADPCSWYQGSIKTTLGTLSNTSGNIFALAGAINWIDLQNGRLYDEDNVMLQTSNEYKPKIYIDDVLQTTGYTVNYPAGEVTFDGTVAGVVTATFYKADKSWFILRPKVGKILSIKAAEVQFGSDTTLNGHFVFEVWLNHPTYGMIPVPGTQIAYKNFKDFVSACNEGQGLIPQIGDLASAVHVFPFDYARPKPIKYSQAVEIRVYCKNHLPCGGTFATTTFYITVDNE